MENKNYIFEEINQSDFFHLMEEFFIVNNIDFGDNLDKYIGIFLKDLANIHKIKQYFVNHKILKEDKELLDYNIEILNKISNFYLGLGNKNIDYKIANNNVVLDSDINKKLSEKIAKELIIKGHTKFVIQYILEKEIAEENELDENMKIILYFFKIKINNIQRVFFDNLESITAKDLLLMMNALKEKKIKYLKFENFSNWHIIDIISFNDFYGKKIINIDYIDSQTQTRQIKNCYLTDDGDILNFKNKFIVKKIFGIQDILGYKFLGAGISNNINFMFDFDNKPVMIKGKYLKTLKKLNMEYKGEEYYALNGNQIVISETELNNCLNKYTSFDVGKEIEFEFFN